MCKDCLLELFLKVHIVCLCVKIVIQNFLKVYNAAFRCGLHCLPKYSLKIYHYTKG